MKLKSERGGFWTKSNPSIGRILFLLPIKITIMANKYSHRNFNYHKIIQFDLEIRETSHTFTFIVSLITNFWSISTTFSKYLRRRPSTILSMAIWGLPVASAWNIKTKTVLNKKFIFCFYNVVNKVALRFKN